LPPAFRPDAKRDTVPTQSGPQASTLPYPGLVGNVAARHRVQEIVLGDIATWPFPGAPIELLYG